MNKTHPFPLTVQMLELANNPADNWLRAYDNKHNKHYIPKMFISKNSNRISNVKDISPKHQYIYFGC